MPGGVAGVQSIRAAPYADIADPGPRSLGAGASIP